MKTVKEILDNNGLYAEDVEDVLHAAAELIQLLCDYTKENEPHAVNAIAEYERIEQKVYHLGDELRDVGLLEDDEK